MQEVLVTEEEIIACLVDGRVVSVPQAWSWRLSEATRAQRANFRLIGTGQVIHWSQVEEGISVEGLLCGTPARRPRLGAAAARIRTHAPANKRMQPKSQETARARCAGRPAAKGSQFR
ncbi:MAG: DUF2442 domain-containing protein [Acidobacteria bacterium]|nr:DUF2442 domain-containing protein [Acidobacteriota bacterium]